MKLLGLLLLAAGLPVAAHANCLSEDEPIVVSGTVALAQATSVRTAHPYTYAVLKLDRPLCYRSQEMGDAPRARVLALVADADSPLGDPVRLAGRHLTLSGRVMHRITADQPPQTLMLFEPGLISKPR